METAEVKKLIKDLQVATTTGKPEDGVTILKQLKQNVVATEELLRETKAGLAIGKLRSHPRKEVADLAKELVRKWKEAVEASKKAKAGAKPTPPPVVTSKPAPSQPSPVDPPRRKQSISTPTVPTPISSKPTPTPTRPQSNVVRTIKTDGVKIESKGDKTRDKCMELLYDAMASDSGAPIEQILKRVYAIEYQVYKEFDGVTKEYSTKMRRLFNNLKDKKNPGLREAVVSGDIAAERFVKMTPEEMASEDRKQQNSALNEANVHAALGAGEPEAETDAFQCGRCKNYKTRYRQAQTRSADEPMTVCSFVILFSSVTDAIIVDLRHVRPFRAIMCFIFTNDDLRSCTVCGNK
ncbi:transcription factor S-II, central domain protein [Rhizoctonia solani 123E]|uniref:Transcription factor S-II, central domain protein n=1 Tax=Rhizoctonia solani 123E TaxID=1423351 RepID=A0A074RV30_9AGAM|nr:transcription factor S-II, central domain protein [Rhizoctonia solani 123E]